MSITQLSDTEFEQQVVRADQPVLVDFWAPWCAPCQQLMPILDEIAQEYNERLKIFKVNIDENKQAAAKFQVLSIPTLLFFKAGKVNAQIVGARSAEEIKKTIEALL